MIYTPHNVSTSASVICAKTKERLKDVVNIDTATGILLREFRPVRILHGEIQVYEEQYEFIHDIYAGQPKPLLFICYEKQS